MAHPPIVSGARRPRAWTALAFAACTACATAPQPRAFEHTAAVTFPVDRAARAAEKIDRYDTYAVTFRLEKNVPAMSVSVSADYVVDIMGTKKTRKTYFIVEKQVDLSRLRKGEAKYLYAELGRNFDVEWNRDKELIIRSDATKPFSGLDAASMYRIRFTAFANERFDFTVKISADCGVTFLENVK